MNRVQLRLIRECNAGLFLLTEWEQGFINDIGERDENADLTERENKKLNEINSKVVRLRK